MAARVRYAVVGLGRIAQTAVLPAFQHARENSELVALFSDHPKKREQLAKHYGVRALPYDQFDAYISSGAVDAVYIALPNHLHCDFTLRAAKHGVHVLVEKPMAVTPEECERMRAACAERNVKLMVAYRLHFEEANLRAIEATRSGLVGEPRLFTSTLSLQVRRGDIRVDPKKGGGTLFDLGVYCVNAARHLFAAEPVEVLAMSGNSGEERFFGVDEMTCGVLRFPGDRLATLACSFAVEKTSAYELFGTCGRLRLDNAFTYDAPMRWSLHTETGTTTKSYPPRDQFGPELWYFADCVLADKEPEPSGAEGEIDVRIVQALYMSARSGAAVKLDALYKEARPHMGQHIHRPKLPPTKVLAGLSARAE